MSEFELHNIVVALLSTLGGKVTPNKLVEYLQERQSRNTAGCSIVIQKHLTRLAQDIQEPDTFLAKFNDLKDKNVDSLNSYVELLDLISQDTGMKDFLIRTTKPTSCSKAELTKDDLPQVRCRLKKAITKRPPKEDRPRGVLDVSATLPPPAAPALLSWVQRRPGMSWDFPPEPPAAAPSRPLAAAAAVSQESALVADLLDALVGLPGGLVEALPPPDPPAPRSFRVDAALPAALRELAQQVLPLAGRYSLVQRFVEERTRFEFGRVNNALAEAMLKLNKEHLLFVIQLESEFKSGNLTLQKLWFFVQRNMQSLGIAANIASSISKSNAKGGKVLSLLHDNVIGSIGDERAQQLCLKLMEAACVPYMKMLGMWIYRGIISDPINEFLVEDYEVVQREEMPIDYSADYWEKKYAVCRERIPKFLESVADIILKAGKYLNVIRQCGKPVKNKITPIQYKVEEKHYIEAIEQAYLSASRTLLHLVLDEKDLVGRLRSVKHYFLLAKGDFAVAFLNLCERELRRRAADVSLGSVEALMDLALRLSSANEDPYKEDLRAEMLQYDLQYQMFKILSIQTRSEEYWLSVEPKELQMIESFSFNHEVHWPLSLILNRKSLACYQMIFRHLFYCKYIERMICQVWKANKVAKKFQFDDAQHYRAAFALRQRMLHCIQNLEYHMMVEVIEPHWCTLMQRIGKVNNVDEILSCHRDFLDSCLKDCMLTIPAILSTIIKLLTICEEFCKFMQNELVFQGSDVTPHEPHVSFKEKISRFDVEFSAALMKLLDQINELNRDTSEHDRLFNLLYRILALCPSIDEQPFTRCKHP